MRARWGNWEKERGRRGRFKLQGLNLWKKLVITVFLLWILSGGSWAGQGEDINFWHYEWVGCYKLKDRYPRIYGIACDNEAKVRDSYIKVGEGWI